MLEKAGWPCGPGQAQGATGLLVGLRGPLPPGQGRVPGGDSGRSSSDQGNKAYEAWQQLLVAGPRLVPRALWKAPSVTVDGKVQAQRRGNPPHHQGLRQSSVKSWQTDRGRWVWYTGLVHGRWTSLRPPPVSSRCGLSLGV